jgi:hypothetical protein
MTPNLAPLIDAFAGVRVLVLGEAMLDSYLEAPLDASARRRRPPSWRCRAGRMFPGERPTPRSTSRLWAGRQYSSP